MLLRERWQYVGVVVCVVGLAASSARAQTGPEDYWLTMPFVTASIVATAVAIPIATANGAGDESPGGYPYLYGDEVYYPLPATVNGSPSVSFRVQIPAHDDVKITYATLAFIITDGQRVDVEALMEAVWDRVGREPILVPYLECPYNDLYVGVDLGAWCAAGVRDAREDFEFDDWLLMDATGRSSSLPGFLVSETPINFAPHKGFATNDPYDHGVRVGGFYGLQIMPEPATVILLAAGLATLAARRRHRRS